jgi:predicted amidophosphoribosyltransferase
MSKHPLSPIRISGSAFDGIALYPHLEKQTTPSGAGITRRCAFAETIYRYRYQGDASLLHEIASTFTDALRNLPAQATFHGLVMIPPPLKRNDANPVAALVTEVSRLTKIPSLQFAVRDTQDIGNEPRHPADRAFAFSTPDAQTLFRGKRILVIDDIYRSGRSLNRLCALLKNEGGAAGVTVIVGTLVMRV